MLSLPSCLTPFLTAAADVLLMVFPFHLKLEQFVFPLFSVLLGTPGCLRRASFPGFMLTYVFLILASATPNPLFLFSATLFALIRGFAHCDFQFL